MATAAVAIAAGSLDDDLRQERALGFAAIAEELDRLAELEA